MRPLKPLEDEKEPLTINAHVEGKMMEVQLGAKIAKTKYGRKVFNPSRRKVIWHLMREQ